MPGSDSGGAQIQFEDSGRNPAQSGVRAHRVIKGFQIEEHTVLGLGPGFVLLEVDEFAFNTKLP